MIKFFPYILVILSFPGMLLSNEKWCRSSEECKLMNKYIKEFSSEPKLIEDVFEGQPIDFQGLREKVSYLEAYYKKISQMKEESVNLTEEIQKNSPPASAEIEVKKVDRQIDLIKRRISARVKDFIVERKMEIKRKKRARKIKNIKKNKGN